MLFEEKDIKEWKDGIQKYYKEKKEKSVEPVRVNKITHKDIKQKETLYHPILQKYQQEEMESKAVVKDEQLIKRTKDKKMDHSKKYDQKYDIITIENRPNCGKIEDPNDKLKKVLLPSNQVDYNIITNEKVAETLFQNYDKIPSKSIRSTQKKVDFHNSRDYNIISNNYVQNHEEKAKNLVENTKKEVSDKIKKTRDFNCVIGQFYNEEKEKTYQLKREEEQKTHGKNFSSRFPPSWKFRETVIMDPSREVPDEIKVIDQQRKMKKKRYELKHNLEQQYREKDIENQERTKFRIRNKVNVRKYTDEYNKGFDIITLGNIPEYATNIEKYIHHKPFTSTWEKLQMTSHNYPKNKTVYTASDAGGGNNEPPHNEVVPVLPAIENNLV